MGKPTVFFSHSSKDSAIIFSIKRKLDTITGSVLDIFQSSDGQSIPFGHNWVHKIEDGLREASIMFVFITPNSISSSWIYFEAGFAYSKSIDVIPVGLGIDIALLKAPLNLLQGFNISSSDGLNNFISVINKKYAYSFATGFSEDDYLSILAKQNTSLYTFDLKDIFETIDYSLYGEYKDTSGNTILHNISDFFDGIEKYLVTNKIEHSFSPSPFRIDTNNDTHISEKTILVYGIEIVYHIGTPPEKKKEMLLSYKKSRIDFILSPYNMEKSFPLFMSLLQTFSEIGIAYLRFGLNAEYKYLIEARDIAAVVSSYPEEYGLDTKKGRFFDKVNNLKFTVFQSSGHDLYNMQNRYVMSVSFDPKAVTYCDIQCMAESLLAKGIIQNNSQV